MTFKQEKNEDDDALSKGPLSTPVRRNSTPLQTISSNDIIIPDNCTYTLILLSKFLQTYMVHTYYKNVDLLL